MPTITLAQGLNEALRYCMQRDDHVLVMGEDVGRAGGVFRVTDKLQQEFGEQRVIDTPLAESG
ncbi:MAG: alpha-ketoacid dehydrogenase subunit beta, partial [Actinomycetota bacterium]